jgi:SagB-type dehydrogenase family enzyme
MRDDVVKGALGMKNSGLLLLMVMSLIIFSLGCSGGFVNSSEVGTGKTTLSETQNNVITSIAETLPVTSAAPETGQTALPETPVSSATTTGKPAVTVPDVPVNGQISLPVPRTDSDVSIEEAILGRRSVRSFTGEAVTLEQISQLLWAAQGITDSAHGGRSAPSAGARYPLTVYVVIGNATGIQPGVYRYEPKGHMLTKLMDGDLRQTFYQKAITQASVKEAAVDFIITGKFGKLTDKYGDRGIRFTDLEAGHAAQNLCLQAVALKLGVVTAGSFDDALVRAFLKIAEDETPLYVIPAGNI